ncbi:MAG: hypothetical protein A3J27_03145 [Candidatus Tectomicrobia bacterium RIFCSPLOWO2_12_FULL_69_37]|nr:MAG: hypothetical protein A3I72_16360 [Candidatus Tectomicrobia bacterium RIFCSPLOWO2_02_FULL_70_19]OGL60383.1 MAG: hypothetical protein A3J27_03145 [Candidatus Tectomicrobia bacterium RIFCSPLOWO2_12_FULL_69_37]
MTEDPKKPASSPGEEEKEKEARPLGALRNIFGRMAFEKGPAYRDEPRPEDEDIGSREGLRRPGRRRSKAKKPPGPPKPPEAFPGP